MATANDGGEEEKKTGVSLKLDGSLFECSGSGTWQPQIKVFIYRDGQPHNQYKFELSGRENDRELIKDGLKSALIRHVRNKHIIQAKIYESPLTSLLQFFPTGFHAYVVMETESSFISWEKSLDGINIQVSNVEGDVVDMKRFQRRRDKTLATVDRCETELGHVIDFLAEGKFLEEGYNVVTGVHCKKFARDMFENVAEDKSYDYKIRENIAKGEWASVAIAFVACASATLALAVAVYTVSFSCEHQLQT